MEEFEIIRRFFRRAESGSGVVVGIDDDGAVIRPPAGEELVVVTDTLVEGTHFRPEAPAASLGHRVLAVNLSDLAAMGAQPLWFTLNLSLPAARADWLEHFAAGLFALADKIAIPLIGGDTVRGPLSMTVTAVGAVTRGGALLRSGARPGDGIYLTGTVGDAGYAWRALARNIELGDDDPLRRRLEYPEPRLAEGLGLRGLASAVIDLSDGLAADLAKLLEASGRGADCDANALPLSSALRERVEGVAAVDLAIAGGDDYELCFTLAPKDEAELRKTAAGWTCPVTRIGEVSPNPGLRWTRDGKPWTSSGRPHAHFPEATA